MWAFIFIDPELRNKHKSQMNEWINGDLKQNWPGEKDKR